MPTYYNSNKYELRVGDCIYLAPSATYVTEEILSFSGLTKTSDAPYYNPVTNASTLTLSTSASSASFSVSDNDSTIIRVMPVSGKVDMYVNSFSNIPAMRISEGITLKNSKRISKLYFISRNSSESVVDVKELIGDTIIFSGQGP